MRHSKQEEQRFQQLEIVGGMGQTLKAVRQQARGLTA
jgi:hypothetical protein